MSVCAQACDTKRHYVRNLLCKHSVVLCHMHPAFLHICITAAINSGNC